MIPTFSPQLEAKLKRDDNIVFNQADALEKFVTRFGRFAAKFRQLVARISYNQIIFTVSTESRLFHSPQLEAKLKRDDNIVFNQADALEKRESELQHDKEQLAAAACSSSASTRGA
eukprot:Colp12_sorted_trinity150504_noHs@7780